MISWKHLVYSLCKFLSLPFLLSQFCKEHLSKFAFVKYACAVLPITTCLKLVRCHSIYVINDIQTWHERLKDFINLLVVSTTRFSIFASLLIVACLSCTSWMWFLYSMTLYLLPTFNACKLQKYITFALLDMLHELFSQRSILSKSCVIVHLLQP